MEQQVISQRVSYARIELFKNYTPLCLKEKIKKITRNNQLHKFIVDGDGFIHTTEYPDLTYVLGNISPKKLKNTVYFHSNISNVIKEGSLVKVRGSFNTADENKIKKHYGNPFASIIIATTTRSIKIDGDYLKIIFHKSTKRRLPFFKFFKTTKSCSIISINLKNGNFIITKIINKNRTFRTNDFNLLHTTLGMELTLPGENDGGSYLVTKRTKDFTKTEQKTFIEKIYECLGKKMTIPYHYIYYLERNIIDFFVTQRKIKVNNNYFKFLYSYYPQEKFLKKNDRKLIQSICDFLGIKSKISIRLLHQHNNLDLPTYTILCSIFGDDYNRWIAQIDPKKFIPTDDQNNDTQINNIKNLLVRTNTYKTNFVNLTDDDKKSIIRLTNIPEMCLVQSISTITDHLDMLLFIRRVFPEIKIRSKSLEEFNNEHSQFTRLRSKIRKGTVIKYEFHEDIIKTIDKNIVIDDIEYNVNILKTEDEYIEEGEFMHHCVSSYANKSTSIIISIRRKDINDRITCEFNVEDGLCIQSRHFCNGPVPEHFLKCLDQVKNEVKYLSNKKLFDKTKVTEEAISGSQITNDFDFIF